MLSPEAFNRVCRSALANMAAAFPEGDVPPLPDSWPLSEELSKPEPKRYQEYCTVDPFATLLMCTLKVSKLANKIAKSLGFSRVRVLSFKRSPLPPLREGYVSWLYIVPTAVVRANQPREELVITYDLDRLERIAPFDKRLPDFLQTLTHVTYVRDKCLAKAVLHEIGHAVLHMKDIRAIIDKDGAFVFLGAEHEREAWMYSAILWGTLVGCHSVWCRSQGNGNMPDEGYVLA